MEFNLGFKGLNKNILLSTLLSNYWNCVRVDGHMAV